MVHRLKKLKKNFPDWGKSALKSDWQPSFVRMISYSNDCYQNKYVMNHFRCQNAEYIKELKKCLKWWYLLNLFSNSHSVLTIVDDYNRTRLFNQYCKLSFNLTATQPFPSVITSVWTNCINCQIVIKTKYKRKIQWFHLKFLTSVCCCIYLRSRRQSTALCSCYTLFFVYFSKPKHFVTFNRLIYSQKLFLNIYFLYFQSVYEKLQ